MKSPFLFLFFCLIFGTKPKCQKATDDSTKAFDFSEITFHSTACNGTCPEISMNIYKSKKIEVSRGIYKAKGERDTTQSGNFMGIIDDVDYEELITLLKKINWDSIIFPRIVCCDAPVRTIILSYNNKYKQLKSMTPPNSTNSLIDFLVKLAISKSLPKYHRPIDFEDVLE